MKGKVSFLVAVVVLLGACSNLVALVPDVDPLAAVDVELLGDWSPVIEEVEGLQRFARTEGERLIINTADGERDFVAGINLGATVPGKFPGDLAVSAETYRTWFSQIADFGFTSIRIYTMLPPHFYEELRAYNLAHPHHPLYLVHGAWPPETELLASADFFDPSVAAEFERELRDLVDVVHGRGVVEQRPGRAWGTFTADVSPWLLAWAIGIEWDPVTVEASDVSNAGVEPFTGDFFVASPDATPTESWLASMLEVVAAEEASYGRTMPLSFVNWVTTDPLDHPEESDPTEDLVAVDPVKISATDNWPGGYFAGYHVYPYYPDFLRFEPGIADFERKGQPDAYAGMLAALAAHHAGMPLVILEFGVPSSLGSSHDGPQNRDQGNHSEGQQAAINAEMFSIIHEVGLASGFLFEWVDEWFKVTWNTVNIEESERRSMWMNPLNPETHFGVVAYEPGADQRIVVDGSPDEWADQSQVLIESLDNIRELRASHDEGYLYLQVVTDAEEAWLTEPVVIGFDTLDGSSGGLPETDGFFTESDQAIVFDGAGARLLVRASADPLFLQYSRVGFVVPGPGDLEEGNGKWNVYRQLTSRPLTVPTTGVEVPVGIISVGELRDGTTNPNDPDFDSRTTWSASGNTIEARIPWQALGFSDPSRLRVAEFDQTGAVQYVSIDRIGIGAHLGDHQVTTAGYTWSEWSEPEYHTRIKAGTGRLAEMVVRLNSQ